MNTGSFFSRLRQEDAKVAKRVEQTLEWTTRQIQERIMAATPVWTGTAVRNMVWSEGEGGSQAFPGGRPQAGTNRMPLGPEMNRVGTQAAAAATQEALTFKRPFRSYVLSNNAPHIGRLESGALPSPDTSRAPAGMFFVTFHTVVAMLASRR